LLILIGSSIQVGKDGFMSFTVKQNASIWKDGRIVKPYNYSFQSQVIYDGDNYREIFQTPFRNLFYCRHC